MAAVTAELAERHKKILPALSAGDELDDGYEPRPVWEDDTERRRLDHAREEANGDRPVGYAESEGRLR